MSISVENGDKKRFFTRAALYLAIGAAVPAMAQNNDKPQQGDKESSYEEEVVIKGFRRSLMNSIDAKRMSDTVVEVVSADDIGGLPDVSIADALARLPGVSTVRTGGQAGAINIRGLSGDFVFATLNGREQVSPSLSRSVEFDQFPSELINEAAVYKSPKASQIEGGVAGSVELKTANPLDRDQPHSFKLNARGSFNDRADEVPDAKKYGYRLSGSYQGKFVNDSLGFAVGYSRLYQPDVATQFVGFAYTGAQQDYNNDGVNDAVSEGFELQHLGGQETRDGVMASIQWEPSSTFTLQWDVYGSEFESESFARGFRVKTLHDVNNNRAATVVNPIVRNNAVVGGRFYRDINDEFDAPPLAGADNTWLVQTTNDDNTDNDKVFSSGLFAEWVLGSWTLSADLSTSEAESEFINGVNWALAFEDSSATTPIIDDNIWVDYRLNGLTLPDVAFSRDYTNLDSVMLAKAGIYPYDNTDEINAVRFDATYQFDGLPIASVEFGVRFSDREYHIDRSVFEYGNDFGQYGVTGQAPLRLTPDMVERVSFTNEFSHFPDYLAIDLDSALTTWLGAGNYEPVQSWESDWTVVSSGRVDEEVNAAYVMANLDTELFGLELTGNIGLRVVETEQSSTSVQQLGPGLGVPLEDGRGVISNDYIPVTLGKSYTDYLPSMNLNFHLSDSDILRFAAASVMARPPINKLKAGGGSWIDNGQDTFNVWGSTSPYLDPFYANQYDLSYEHYFDDSKGAFAVALFYKDIESFIDDITIDPFDFAAAGIEIPAINPNTGNPLRNGQYQTAINNDEGGYIQGIELSYSRTFERLPAPWSGLGMDASYSYNDTEVTRTSSLGGEEREIGLPGLSPNILSTTIFYDYENFSTRINYRYRESFVAEQVAVETQEVFYADETVIDFQLSYAFDIGLDLVFQINNLTDEPTKTYFTNEEQTGTIQYFGRQLFLGVNYSF